MTRGLLLAVLCALPWVTPSAQFRAGVSVVRVPVVVSGPDGVLVQGLRATDFEIREEGRPQQVVALAVGSAGDLPLHLGLMLDRSQSMEADIGSASAAVVKFVELVDEAHDVTFVEFDSHVRVGRYTPDNYLRLFERIRQPALGMQTALYDAMAHYLDGLSARGGQHVLVVYTDGEDSASRLRASDVRDRLRAADIVLYVVGYMEHQRGSARLQQQAVLTQLARETGGDAFFPMSMKQVTSFYDRIRQEIGGRYVLGYVPSGPPPRGEFRRVEVRVKGATEARVKSRARSGYVAVGPP